MVSLASLGPIEAKETKNKNKNETINKEEMADPTQADRNKSISIERNREKEERKNRKFQSLAQSISSSLFSVGNRKTEKILTILGYIHFGTEKRSR